MPTLFCNLKSLYDEIAVAKVGIGPEIMDAVLSIFNATSTEYEFVEMGKMGFDKGYSNGVT